MNSASVYPWLYWVDIPHGRDVPLIRASGKYPSGTILHGSPGSLGFVHIANMANLRLEKVLSQDKNNGTAD